MFNSEGVMVVGGRASRLQVGACLVLPIHAVETNRRAPPGARLTEEQALAVQAAAREAALATGSITPEKIAKRTLPLAIFPQSLDPEVAELSVRALRVLVEKSPDRRSMEMGYWRSWLAKWDAKRRAAPAAVQTSTTENTEGSENGPKVEGSGDPLKAAWVEQLNKQNADGGTQKADDGPKQEPAKMCGGGLHGKAVEVLPADKYVLAALEKDDGEYVTQAFAEKTDWAALVKEAEGKLARLYLYERTADGQFVCVERWPAKPKEKKNAAK